MPYFVSKVPGSLGSLSVASSTETATHELVEAATDPIPLSANIDSSKSPPWIGGEIADICSVGTPPSIVTGTRFGLTVASFWSNSARLA